MEDSRYEKYIEQWNEVFNSCSSEISDKITTGNADLNEGLIWAGADAERVLDFGCGNGTILFFLAQHGTQYNYGIDLSEQAVISARKRSSYMKSGRFEFVKGGVESLKGINSCSFDAVILSNIIDNLYLNDAITVLNESSRILKKGGRILVKLNPFITDKQIKEGEIKELKDGMLDDGMLLLNKSTEEWKEIFERYFVIKKYKEIYFEKFNQYNRMFLMTKRYGDK